MAVSFLRGMASLALFALFGAGSLAITPAALLLRRPDRCQRVVYAMWKLMVLLCSATGLLKVDAAGLARARGCVIAANHPSLIDVVLLTALVPRTLYVAKSALLANPVLGAIVRRSALPDDETLPSVAAPYLAAGWNVLIFPEGTRSVQSGEMRDFRRGAAQLALRAAAPVLCVGIRFSRGILGKGQKPWDAGAERISVRLRSDGVYTPALDPARGFRPQAVEATAEMRRRIAALIRD